MTTPLVQNQVDRTIIKDKVWSDQLTEEFNNYTDTQLWTKYSLGGSGSVAIDTTNGTSKLKLSTAATQWDVEAIRTTNKLYLIQAAQDIHLGMRFNYTNQASGNALVYFGLSDTSVNAVGTTATAPTGLTYGTLLYKLSSATLTTWGLITSNTTQNIYTSTTQASDGYYDLDLDIIMFSATQAKVIPLVNGQPLIDANNNQVVGFVNYASMAGTYLVCGCQAGTGNVQTMFIDYIETAKFRLN